MKKKIKRGEYLLRRLNGVKKKRLRKKLANNIERHFLRYCVKHQGLFEAATWMIYGPSNELLAELIYRKSSIIDNLSKEDPLGGSSFPIPEFKIE